jgi:hypothetical protein
MSGGDAAGRPGVTAARVSNSGEVDRGHGARARRRMARVHSSPPGAALGQIHSGDAAATAEK